MIRFFVLGLALVAACSTATETIDSRVASSRKPFLNEKLDDTGEARKGVFVSQNDSEGLNISIPFGRLVRKSPLVDDMSAFVKNGQFSAKRTPDIYIFFNDTWRADSVRSEIMPHIVDFQRDAVSPAKAYSPATTTYHSLFGILNALPSFLHYPLVRTDLAKMGALPLNILVDRLGYQFHLDVWGSEIDCMEEILNVDSSSNFLNYKYLYQASYGYKMNLINECRNSTMLGNNHIRHEKEKVSGTFKRFADMDLAVMNSAFKRSQSHQTGHHIYFMHTMSLHTPYSWREDLGKLFEPNENESENKPSNPSLMQNNYKNAAMSFDKSFGEFIQKLKDDHKYDDALIVVLGDHGEAIGEKIGDEEIWHHGFRNYNSRISIPLMIKFPGDNRPYQREVSQLLVSSYDIMPTVLDYLGIENYGQEFYLGKSMISNPIPAKERNVISVRPCKQSCDTHEMALINDSYKLIIRIQKDQDPDILKADGIKIVAITDLLDNPIEQSKKFAKFKLAKGAPVQLFDEFVDLIKTDFAESLTYMFPKL